MNGTAPSPSVQVGTPAADPPAEVPANLPALAPAEFGEVFASYASYVLVLLRRLGIDQSDADDVAQEVFIAVHRGLAEFEGRSSLKTWVSGICVRAASNHRRKAHRRRERPTAELEPQVEAQQHAQIERREQVERLQRALLQLSERQREVFVLYEIEQLTMPEVARLVGCGRFTAYTRLRLARSAMRKLFTAELVEGARTP